MLYAIFGVLAIILDQWVKYWAAGNLTYGGEARTLIPGVINLLNVHNDGAAFSFLSGANAGKIFVILAIVFAVLVIVGLITNFISGKLARWSAVFVAAGGIGNAIDRALYGYVQDMFQFSFWESFPVFNVADIFICVFCLIFILCILFGEKSSRNEDDIEYYEEEEAYEEEDAPKRRRSGRRSADDFETDEAPVRSKRPGRRGAEDDYEEEPAPKKRGFARRGAEDDYEEEPAPKKRGSARRGAEDDFEEETAPQNRASARNERRSFDDDGYDRYRSGRSVNNAQEKVPVSRKPAAPASQYNPFAEWEASTAADSRRPSPAKPVYDDFDAQPKAPARPAAPKQPERPAAPAKPAAPSKSGSGDFDLDDILAEFK